MNLPVHLTHSLKTCLACLLGYFFSYYFDLPMGQWVLITIIVVMSAQSNVGGFLKKSYARILGTFFGALAGILGLYFFADSPYALAALSLGAISIFVNIATRQDNLSYAGTLGAVTVLIVLLQSHPTLSEGFWRIAEVSLGILISAVINLFVLPSYASDLFYETVRANFRSFHEVILLMHADADSVEMVTKAEFISESIVKNLYEQRRLLAEGKLESLWRKGQEKRQALYHKQRHFFRYLHFVEYSYWGNPQVAALLKNTPRFKHMLAALNQLLERLATKSGLNDRQSLTSYLDLLQDVNREMHEQILQTVGVQDAKYIHAFLMAFEQLVEQLEAIIKTDSKASS